VLIGAWNPMLSTPDPRLQAEQVILDVNVLGEGKSHCDIQGVKYGNFAIVIGHFSALHHPRQAVQQARSPLLSGQPYLGVGLRWCLQSCNLMPWTFNVPGRPSLHDSSLASLIHDSSINVTRPSPDHSLLAYAADYSGNETYAATIMDIATGKVIESEVTGLAGSVTWGKDGTSFFYNTEDEAKRPHKVWKHVIGTKQSDDVCLYTDNDELYYVGCGKSKSDRYLLTPFATRA